MEQNVGLRITAKDEASAKLDQVRDKLRGAGREGEDYGEKLQKTGLAITAVGAGLTAYSKVATSAATDYVKSVNRISRETGLAVDSTSQLLYAFQRSGMGADDASVALTSFSRKLVAAGDANSGAGKTFAALGIQTRDSAGQIRNMSELLPEVAERFQTMENGAEKTALATELFGRNGRALLPILNEGSEGFAKMAAEADKLGLTLTPENVDKVNAYVKAQGELKRSQEAFTLAVGQEAIPMWKALADWQLKAVRAYQEMPGPIKEVVTAMVAFGGPVLLATGAMASFIGSIGDATPVVSGLAKKIPFVGGALGGVAKFMTNPWVLAITVAVGAVVLLMNHFKLLEPTIKAVGDVINFFATNILPILQPAFDTIRVNLEEMQPLWEKLVPALEILAKVLAVTIVASFAAAAVGIVAVVTVLTYVAAAISAFAKTAVDNFMWFVNTAISLWNRLTQLGAIIQTALSIGPWIGAALGGIIGMIGGWVGTFFSSGRGLIEAFGNGIRAAFGSVRGAVEAGLGAVRRLLPFSDAKEGPLSDLTKSGRSLFPTMAKGVQQGAGALYSAVAGGLNGLPSDTTIATPAVSGSAVASAGQVGPSAPITNNYLNGTFNFKNQQDIDYMLGKIDRSGNLTSRGLAG